MLTFNYKARDLNTKKVIHSSIQADSEAMAAKSLMSQNIIPLEITPVAEGGIFSNLRSNVTNKDLVIFTRQLATMLNAGLPLSQSMSTVAEQTNSRSLKTIVGSVINNIQGGSSLSESLAKYPKVFNNFYIALVKAGETSGTLDKSLERLANQQEHDANMLSKIRGAMIYPAIVLAVIVAVVIFMLVSLVPQVSNLYEEMGRSLPLQTVILVGIERFMVKFWWIIAVAAVSLILFLRHFINTPSGRKMWDTIKLNIPMFNPLFRKLYMARFSRTSQTLLASGVSIIETLKISGDAVNNVVVKEEILQGIDKVKNGKPLSEALSNQDYILKFVPQMIKIGESSGGIDAMLGKVADYYDKEVDDAIAAIQTLIEPVLMVIMAFMIGFIVLAVLLPIYELSSVTVL